MRAIPQLVSAVKLMYVTVVTLTLILAYVACKFIMVILIPFFLLLSFGSSA